MDAFHGRFYISGEFREKYVVVDRGIIREVKSEMSGMDVKNIPGHIFPGGIDMHVHFRDPGETEKEDFRTGSLSAIFGGTTTVCDMPNNKIPIDNRQSFESKLSEIRNRSFVDFGLYQAASGVTIPEAVGQKIFLGKSTGGLLTELDDCEWQDKVKVVHAELQECIDNNNKESKDLVSHDMNRPLECELEAIEYIFKYNLANTHIAHLTSSRSLELAKSLGFTTEVTPHHLLLNNSSPIGSFGKVNPPLRKKSVQEELLNILNSKSLDVIASDHAPHTAAEKEVFKDSPSGMPGVETRVPLILSLFKKGLIQIERTVSTLMEKPAEICRINKGFIAEGYDADFISVDLKNVTEIMGDELHSKCGWTPFEKFEGIFPDLVYLRGEMMIQEGEVISSPSGAFLNAKKQ
ncbi:MAG: dihydroorotase [Thermoplasmatales archaeon]|jgi:dihydroorotase|nr:dihydroorotase [Candidatus Thermoplasmatota archaeon]MCL6002129.1 dihydroorotase [Candidatus Thermoplasmatota archaeon]MDA8055295.1 dihydroorotase [Thermoplasmatales archaeon]